MFCLNKGIKPDEEELRKICRIADSSGKVKIKVIGPDNQIDPQSNSGLQINTAFQITKADFEKYSRDSEIFKQLDKNKDGHVSVRELTSKAELAFKVVFVIQDGQILIFHEILGTRQR